MSSMARNPLSQHRDSRIMGDAWAWITDPLHDWSNESQSMASLAWALVQTDPYAAAMLNARLTLTHGPSGLHFRSTYQADDDLASNDAERKTQRQLTEYIKDSWCGTWVDAGRQMTRSQLERQLDTCAIVAGDGFAVRVFNPNRVGTDMATSWRIIAPERVKNPTVKGNWDHPGKPDIGETPPASHCIWEGIELDELMQPVALWIETPSRDPKKPMACTYQRVPWWSEAGIPNVIHRFVSVRPGQLRGFSAFAPIFVHAAQLKGTAEAHVVAKRTQAAVPTLIRSSDPEVAARFARQGATLGPNTQFRPGLIAYVGEDADIINQSWSYDGGDFSAFVDAEVRAMSASWGLPWQFVLAQLTNANLASSRAALDQAERTASAWQDSHISACTSIIDQSLLAEGMAKRDLPRLTMREAIRGRYLRPRTWSTDRKKEADAAKAWHELGKSLTSIYSEQGLDFEAEAMQSKQDEEFLALHGLKLVPETATELDENEPNDEKNEPLDDDETQEMEPVNAED